MHYSIIFMTECVKLFAQGKSCHSTVLMYSSSISKCLMIYKTAVICKRIVLFLVFYARRTNEGVYAKVALVDICYFINAMGRRTLINVQSFVLKAKRCFYLFL